MDNKVLKTLKGKDEIRRFYQFPLRGSENVEMGGKSYYMVIQKLDEYGKPIQHKVKYPKSNIREKQCGNCGKTVGVEYFYTDSYNVSGYSHWCKVCCKNYMTQYTKEKNKFIAKFGNLNSERAAFAKSQVINREILSNSSNI